MTMSKTASLLPGNYVDAKRALRRCIKHFSPSNYAAARLLLEAVLIDDQCEALSTDLEKLKAYSKIADDNGLMRLAGRLDAIHRAWKADCDKGDIVQPELVGGGGGKETN